MKTPTLDRVNALREKLDICGEFLDFILEKFDVFNPELKREEPFYIGSGDYINKENNNRTVNLSDDFIKEQIRFMAHISNVPVEKVKLISKEEYEANTECD